MNTWMLIWKVVFIVGMLLFVVMAVWVTIGGAADIKRLFARMDAAHAETAAEPKAEDAPPPAADPAG